MELLYKNQGDIRNKKHCQRNIFDAFIIQLKRPKKRITELEINVNRNFPT